VRDERSDLEQFRIVDRLDRYVAGKALAEIDRMHKGIVSQEDLDRDE